MWYELCEVQITILTKAAEGATKAQRRGRGQGTGPELLAAEVWNSQNPEAAAFGFRLRGWPGCH